MAICPYERKDPVIYAAQRHPLGVRVRDGMPVRAAARVLNIPYSTAWRWVALDGLRRADRAADEAGVPRPPVGRWARDTRKALKARPSPEETGDGLPPSDYPELKGLAPRARLAALGPLADLAEARALAAIEEGCITLGLASLREGQRLRRAWRALREGPDQDPELEAADEGEQDWRAGVAEELRALAEGREPVRPPPRPKTEADIVSDEIWAAIHAAEAEDLARRGVTRADIDDEAHAFRQLDLLQEHQRLMRARARWMSLPGRTPPVIVVRLPERRRGWLKEK